MTSPCPPLLPEMYLASPPKSSGSRPVSGVMMSTAGFSLRVRISKRKMVTVRISIFRVRMCTALASEAP